LGYWVTAGSPPGTVGNPGFCEIAVGIINRLVAVQGQDTSVRNELSWKSKKKSRGLMISVRMSRVLRRKF
jgi:hypothetical protein